MVSFETVEGHRQLWFVTGIWSVKGSLNCVPVLTEANFVLVFQVNLFVLLSMISVMLNVTGLILGCQGIQFVSRVPRCDLVSTYTDLCLFLLIMAY